jgi:hypothetical protein
MAGECVSVSFDQYDPRLPRVDVAEVLPQILMCEFSDRTGQFHACRPAAKALPDEPLPLFAAASVREAKTVPELREPAWT